MATIINNPPATGDSSNSNGIGTIVAVLLLILFVIGLLYYGLPYMRRTVATPSTQINVPDKVEVDVNTPQQ